MPAISRDFQRAIHEAREKKSTHLSLRGDKDSLGRNVLFTIPEAVFELSALETLDLSNNQLRALPADLDRLKKLKQLNVALNPLEEITDRPGLMLDSDQVQTFVEEKKCLSPQNVIGIRFRRSGLKRLAQWFSSDEGSFRHLTSVDLSHCLLQILPKTISQLHNLTSLNLGGNQLRTLPEDISQLQQLTSLYLWGNGLRIFPESVLQLQQLTTLHLWGTGLKTLPESISQLKRLSIINLSNNELKSLPTSFFQLQQLTYLYLWGNKLRMLPESFSKLQQLSALHLSNNELRKLPEPVTRLIHLSSLYLSDNKLNRLPESIAMLEHLTFLDLSWNRLNTLPASITKLKHLASLDLSGNALMKLPKPVTQLNHLTFLDLAYNGLGTFPDSITQLERLSFLSLSNNGLSKVPESISQLRQLTSLGLWGNKLDALPNPITRLENLSALDLGNNSLSDLPESISRLKNLTSLQLSRNKLSSLPKSLAQLNYLTSLNLSNNKLTSLPKPISQLKHLSSLDLSSNALKTLPESISQLKNLCSLSLNYNKLLTLPESVTNLKNLMALTLGGNILRTLPESISNLKQLITLDLAWNRLSTFPEFLTQLKNLTTIDLSNTQIKSPPKEVIEKGILAIENYFQQAAEQGGTLPLYEARILIVGEAGAGKTTLKKKLLDPNYILPEKGEDSTLGIQVENNWVFPFEKNKSINFTAHLWDFGGQEIQYMTHQFFLRDRSLYILVADDRRQDADFDYWFKAIHLFGKDSPVLVVLNERNYKSVTNFDVSYYQKLYPELEIHQFAIDLGQDKERVLKLIKQVQVHCAHLKHIGDEIPKQWVPIREALAKRQKEHHISYKDFLSICETHQVTDEQSALFISDYLDALGLIVHFKNDANLNDFVIVDPQWLVKAVYSLLEDKTLEAQKGQFTQAWLFKLWKQKGYKHDECCKLISLIKKDSFEICFELNNQHQPTYIAPQLLPSLEASYPWQPKDNLHFRFAYPFMPKGIMARLIVRLNEAVAQNDGKPVIWKRGAVFEEGDTQAEVIHQDDPESGIESINIRVQGETRQKRDLLAMVRRELRHIHQRSFQNIAVKELVPCLGQVCAKSKMPKFFEHPELDKIVENKRHTIYCSACNEDIAILTLLEGIVDVHRDRNTPNSEKQTEDKLRNISIKIENNPNMSQQQNVTQESNISISIEVKNKIVMEMSGLLDNLKEDLLDEIEDEASRTRVAKEVGKVEHALTEINTISKPEEAKTKSGALSRIKSFITKLQDSTTTAGKAITALEDGLGYA